jgi:hypothetical protein
MGSLNSPPQASGLAVVIDTSFIRDHCEGYHWTIEPFEVLKHQDSRLVVTKGVAAEYDRWNKTRPNPNGIGTVGIAGLFNVGRVESYESGLNNVLAEKLGQAGYTAERRDLSPTDESVTQVAKRMALHGRKVAVATADMDIVAELDAYRDETNSRIDIYSPDKVPKKHDDIGLLITDHAIQQLTSIPQGDNHRKYFMISNGMNIGWGVKYDIAFAVYVNRNNALVNPRVNGAECVRILDAITDPSTANVNPTDIRVISSPRFFIYHRQGNDATIDYSVVANPLSPQSLNDLMKEAREIMGEGLDDAQLEELKTEFGAIVGELGVESKRWARFNENFLRTHEPKTLGALQRMRTELGKQFKF